MCGIAGIVDWGRPPEESVVRAMVRRMAHRGPDAEGIEAYGAAVLGHRRLAIIDLSPDGIQPMQDRDGQVAITFNGEIYNYKELRAQLEAEGARFRTATDTEVILEAYKRWGPDCLQRL